MRLLTQELIVSDDFALYLPIPKDKRLRLITDTLLASPHNTLSIDDWGVKNGVTGRTVHRLFLKETNMTFAHWREHARLLHALRRIASGEKIQEIALDCGYNSASAFTAMFRRRFGAPPSSFYRRNP